MLREVDRLAVDGERDVAEDRQVEAVAVTTMSAGISSPELTFIRAR